MIDDAIPASKADITIVNETAIEDYRPTGITLNENIISSVKDKVDSSHGLEHQKYSREELFGLRLAIEVATNNERAIETPTINTSGNVAAAVHLNKDPYYTVTFGACCSHYLHHGECRKKEEKEKDKKEHFKILWNSDAVRPAVRHWNMFNDRASTST